MPGRTIFSDAAFGALAGIDHAEDRTFLRQENRDRHLEAMAKIKSIQADADKKRQEARILRRHGAEQAAAEVAYTKAQTQKVTRENANAPFNEEMGMFEALFNVAKFERQLEQDKIENDNKTKELSLRKAAYDLSLSNQNVDQDYKRALTDKARQEIREQTIQNDFLTKHGITIQDAAATQKALSDIAKGVNFTGSQTDGAVITALSGRGLFDFSEDATENNQKIWGGPVLPEVEGDPNSQLPVAIAQIKSMVQGRVETKLAAAKQRMLLEGNSLDVASLNLDQLVNSSLNEVLVQNTVRNPKTGQRHFIPYDSSGVPLTANPGFRVIQEKMESATTPEEISDIRAILEDLVANIQNEKELHAVYWAFPFIDSVIETNPETLLELRKSRLR